MAVMIPTEPYEYTTASLEGDVFNYLKKNLPDDYYVFHSFKTNTIDLEANELTRHEIDFLVFHPKFGIICIEVKHGQTGKVVYENRQWYFLKEGNDGFITNRKINQGGPFRQAEARKESLAAYIGNQEIMLDGHKDEPLKEHCKVTYAVCFPGMTSDEGITYTNKKQKTKTVTVKEMLQGAGTPEQLVIFKDDLEDPSRLTAKIKNIYGYI